MLENSLLVIVLPLINAGVDFLAIVMLLMNAGEYFVSYFLAISECE